MNTKVLLGFLAGLLAASGVFYVQSHRAVKVTPEPEPVAALTPVATAPPSPEPASIPQPPKPAAPKKLVSKPVAAPEPNPLPPSVEQVKAEPAPAPEPPPPAPAVAQAPLATPIETKVETYTEPPQPRSVTITSGTLINVRLGETISTDRNRQGDSFTATLDQPLVIDGLVIAEKGARATGRVVDLVEAGRVKGLAHLSLELASVMLSDGQKIDLRTERFEKQGESSKAADTQKVGIGAAIGAAIGAIAGGGKGAAIGAASGGAAGGGVVAATRGKPAMLPAETKISFRVEQPITISEKK